jgi:hypothetical protein
MLMGASVWIWAFADVAKARAGWGVVEP